MLEILGENYYIDIDKLVKYVNVESSTGMSENTISVVKFEVIQSMLDVILSESDPIDETMVSKSSELTIPFKLAFNTLLNKKLINKY